MNGTACPSAPHNRRYKITDLNPHLMCVLCGGYYIDATTIIECLHSFCRTCIVKCLETSKFCPICDVQVHKTKPLLNIRSDQTLQDIVYKLVPGLFQREMKRRRDFYAQQPLECPKTSNPRSNEERGEVDSDFPMNLFKPDEFISIALEYCESVVTNGGPKKESMSNFQRFLRCPVYLTVAHIKKLIRAKCGLSSECDVNLMVSQQDRLSDDYMLMDVAYMYSWKRKGPLKLYFNIVKLPTTRLKMCDYNSFYNGQRTRPNGLTPVAATSTSAVVKTESVIATTSASNGLNTSCQTNGESSAERKPQCSATVTTADDRLTSGISSPVSSLAECIQVSKCGTTPFRIAPRNTTESPRPRKKAKTVSATKEVDAVTNGGSPSTAVTTSSSLSDNNNESEAVNHEAKFAPKSSAETDTTLVVKRVEGVSLAGNLSAAAEVIGKLAAVVSRADCKSETGPVAVTNGLAEVDKTGGTTNDVAN